MITPLNVRIRFKGDLLSHLKGFTLKCDASSLCLFLEVTDKNDEIEHFLVQNITNENNKIYFDVILFDFPPPKLFDTEKIIKLDDFR